MFLFLFYFLGKDGFHHVHKKEWKIKQIMHACIIYIIKIHLIEFMLRIYRKRVTHDKT